MQVWDWQKKRWFMVASHMRMAVSKHKGGAIGWKGYSTQLLFSTCTVWTNTEESLFLGRFWVKIDSDLCSIIVWPLEILG